MDELTKDIVETAIRMIESCSERANSPLDYSEASLVAVDELLSEAADFVDEMSPEQINLLAQDFGCYMLEVGRREFGGRYLWFEQRDQPLLVVGEPAFRVALLT
ncbi:MAG: hypothetical protein AB7K24_02975 [Gemmataceae bacterium]